MKIRTLESIIPYIVVNILENLSIMEWLTKPFSCSSKFREAISCPF